MKSKWYLLVLFLRIGLIVVPLLSCTHTEKSFSEEVTSKSSKVSGERVNQNGTERDFLDLLSSCEMNNVGDCIRASAVLVSKNDERIHAGILPIRLQTACDDGNGVSCYYLGILFEKGIAVSNDKASARDFFFRSCNFNYSLGCQVYALDLFEGNGGSENKTMARNAFMKACDLSDSQSCLNLGWMFFLGQGGGIDKIKAKVSFTKSCAAGNNVGCNLTSWMAIRGDGGQQVKDNEYSNLREKCSENETDACRLLNNLALKGFIKQSFCHGADLYRSSEDHYVPTYIELKRECTKMGIEFRVKNRIAELKNKKKSMLVLESKIAKTFFHGVEDFTAGYYARSRDAAEYCDASGVLYEYFHKILNMIDAQQIQIKKYKIAKAVIREWPSSEWISRSIADEIQPYFGDFADSLCEFPSRIWKSGKKPSSCSTAVMNELAHLVKSNFIGAEGWEEGEICAQL